MKPWQLRPLASLTLAAFAGIAWATPPQLPFPDLSDAYGLGNITEARVLGRRYLLQSSAEVQTAATPSARADALSRLLRAATLVLLYEANFPIAGRFRRAMDLETKVESALALAEASLANLAEPAKTRVQSSLDSACRYWMIASFGVRPHADRIAFFAKYRSFLDRAGVHAVDEPSIRQLLQPPKPTAAEQQLVTGMVRRSTGVLAKPEFMAKEAPCVVIYLPGVRRNGKRVDWVLRSCPDQSGALTLRIPEAATERRARIPSRSGTP